MRPAHHLFLALFTLSTGLAPFAAGAGKLYRWTDAEGNVHYSDKIPVEAAGRGRTELNKRGLHIDQQAPAKTKEEYEREQMLERLRVEQQALIEEQKQRDSALLRSYRTEDDIIMARNGKLAAVDTTKQVIESNIRLTKSRLDDMQGRAAAIERQGRQLDKGLEGEIEKTWKRLNNEYAKLLNREREKEAIAEEYAGYLSRFRELHNVRGDAPPPALAENPPVELETVVVCNGPDACDAAWKRAKAYRALHSTTGAQIAADSIVTSLPPVEDRDLSITVSRLSLDGGSREQIFLDPQCRQNPLGAEFCAGEKVRSVRQGFRSFVSQE